jgi:hypothetical protein
MDFHILLGSEHRVMPPDSTKTIAESLSSRGNTPRTHKNRAVRG